MKSGMVAVVPCRDDGATLAEALASLQAQTRPPDEVVVVDDGSTDPATLRELERLEDGGPLPLQVLRTAQGGAAAARNAGIAASLQPLVVCLDADDLLHPSYLREAVGRLNADPQLGFVSSGLQAFGGASYAWAPPLTIAESLARGSVHQSTVFRRSLFEAVGGFDPGCGPCANLDFWLTVLERGHQGAVIPEPRLRYRVRPDSSYHGLLEKGELLPWVERVLARHRASIEAGGADLLLGKEAFVLEQRAHGRALRQRRHELEAESVHLSAEIDSIREALAARPLRPVDLGELRRLTPLSPVWGLDRGGPLDRHYIENFLHRHRADVRGRVLEVKDSTYARRFGGERVVQADVIDVDATNPDATLIADLTAPDALPEAAYDCFVLTQTLHLVYDVHAVVRSCARLLKPGGVLLCTAPAVRRIDYEDGGLQAGDFWRFTEASLRRLFAEAFAPGGVEVQSFGNVLAATAFLYGLAPRELTPGELDHVDPWFPVLYGVRAVQPGSGRG